MIGISSQDLLRYLTEELVRYMGRSKGERRERREQKVPWQYRLFGQIPTTSLYVIRAKRRGKIMLQDRVEQEQGSE